MNGLFSHGATLPPADFRAQPKKSWERTGARRAGNADQQQSGPQTGTGVAAHVWKEQEKQRIFLLESVLRKMTLE